ncbi:hypothetical protein P6144_13925 [Sphingomonas sp. HITSZ_GF]|uniref:hypothetical protein n=1 Tax=Sphingomonas sp. HITSZ_GF TaxID=3037247 RepID=UPI00240E4480|nr:hypothetical protein [Sphingomonas sp. HITSZ_GF]MDG2534756.1 hypothetical protein [Sphingomonas sp. HITSZ_GF]
MAVLERSRLAQFALFLLVAIALRCPAWGEWNYAVDDQYFALVGQRLLAGDLLYVDIWDRKPPLLYLAYAAIACLNPSVLAYQLVATMLAAAGAWGTARIARLLAPLPASLMAGIAYLAFLTRFGGGNGEAAVFYNPLIVFAAWSIATSIERLRAGELPPRVLLGMLSAGLAIGFKQSAAFEAIFLGLAVLALLGRHALGWRALALAAIGALPMAGVALFYAAIGHFPALWQALVLSNFARVYDAGRLARGLAMAGLLCLPLALAAAGYWRARVERAAPLGFLFGWALAATAGVALFPGLYLHYALPLAAPLAILAAPFFARPRIGAISFVALIALNLATADMFALQTRARARPAAAALVAHVRAVTPHHRLLVFGMPSYLYAEIGAPPPRPLAFPAHYYEGAESRASGTDEVAALARVLAAGPETVVVQEPLPAAPLNQANVAQLARYLQGCSNIVRLGVYDHEGEKRLAVHSGCHAPGPVPIAAPVR